MAETKVASSLPSGVGAVQLRRRFGNVTITVTWTMRERRLSSRYITNTTVAKPADPWRWQRTPSAKTPHSADSH